MVLISFSSDNLIYKILSKSKITTIRPLNIKWRRVLDKYNSDNDEEIKLDFWYHSRSKYGFKFSVSVLKEIEIYNLERSTEIDAILDGFSCRKELLKAIEGFYGEGYLEKEYVRIWWDGFKEKISKPNKTSIDWFEKDGQELYTINPLILHKKWCLNCFYDCFYRYVKPIYKWQKNNFIEGFYEGRIRGLKYAKENVFISSTTDIFHSSIPILLNRYIVEKCNEYNENKCNLYFLTKNPRKYRKLLKYFPEMMNMTSLFWSQAMAIFLWL